MHNIKKREEFLFSRASWELDFGQSCTVVEYGPLNSPKKALYSGI